MIETSRPFRGHADTLRAMCRLAAQGAQHRVIRLYAEDTLRDVEAHSPLGEIAALCAAVHRDIRYTSDPLMRERVSSPADTLADRHGDCDDMATLLAAMLMSVGYAPRFLLVGYKTRGPYTHVCCLVPYGGKLLLLDPVTGPAFTGDMLVMARRFRWYAIPT